MPALTISHQVIAWCTGPLKHTRVWCGLKCAADLIMLQEKEITSKYFWHNADWCGSVSLHWLSQPFMKLGCVCRTCTHYSKATLITLKRVFVVPNYNVIYFSVFYACGRLANTCICFFSCAVAVTSLRLKHQEDSGFGSNRDEQQSQCGSCKQHGSSNGHSRL